MNIYSIGRDIDNFKVFTVDDRDVYDKMEDFDINGFGRKLKFEWIEPNSFFIDNDNGSEKLPDISTFGLTELLLSPEARKALDNYLFNQGEYLLLEGAAKDYCLFNPIQRIGNEIVNSEKTKSLYFDDGSWDRIEKLVLNVGAENSVPSVFTLELTFGTTLFCNQDFKDAVEQHGLKGLIFSVVEQA